jgi:YuzL-like protein
MIFPVLDKLNIGGDLKMAKGKKNPSRAGVSAASVKGNAGPTVEEDGGGKVNSQNNQYKK